MAHVMETKCMYDNLAFINKVALITGITGQDGAYLAELLLEKGIPCGPIYAMDQVFSDPQVQHLEAIGRVMHPTLGELALLNQSIKLTRTPSQIVASSPLRGQHTAEILTELGYDSATIDSLTKNAII